MTEHLNKQFPNTFDVRVRAMALLRLSIVALCLTAASARLTLDEV